MLDTLLLILDKIHNIGLSITILVQPGFGLCKHNNQSKVIEIVQHKEICLTTTYIPTLQLELWYMVQYDKECTPVVQHYRLEIAVQLLQSCPLSFRQLCKSRTARTSQLAFLQYWTGGMCTLSINKSKKTTKLHARTYLTFLEVMPIGWAAKSPIFRPIA